VDRTELDALIEAAQQTQDSSDYASLERLAHELIERSEKAGDKRGLAWAYYYLGSAYFQRNDGAAADRALRRCHDLFCEIGDEYGQARAMLSFGAVALDVHHDHDHARMWYDRAVPIVRRSGDRRRLAVTLGNLSEICRSEGSVAKALQYAGEALAIFRELGQHTDAGWICADIAHYHALRRDYRASFRSLREAYAELAHQRNPRWIAWYLDIAFILAAALGRWETAASLLGFTEHYRDVNRAPRMQALLAWTSAPIEELAKRANGDERLARLRNAGEALTLEEAQAFIEQLASAIP
jgi:tetratricopeptide (TPR) repeat protein